MDATSFISLCASGTPREIEAALDGGARINGREESGSPTPLHAAAAKNPNPEVIELLVKRGADVNARCGNGGITVLMFAAQFNSNPEVIESLLKNGAQKNAKNNDGRKAIDAAKYSKNYAAISVLEEKFEGCYIATCVYGSYDCPEVWTLRRFRDDTLSKSRFGRAFIRFYYAVSPKIVKLFGNARWFKKLCKPIVDRLVARLRSNGVDNDPYSDKF